jgi:hypothetical protein
VVGVDGCVEEAASDAADSVGDGEPVPSDGVIVTRDACPSRCQGAVRYAELELPPSTARGMLVVSGPDHVPARAYGLTRSGWRGLNPLVPVNGLD